LQNQKKTYHPGYFRYVKSAQKVSQLVALEKKMPKRFQELSEDEKKEFSIQHLLKRIERGKLEEELEDLRRKKKSCKARLASLDPFDRELWKTMEIYRETTFDPWPTVRYRKKSSKHPDPRLFMQTKDCGCVSFFLDGRGKAAKKIDLCHQHKQVLLERMVEKYRS